MKDNSDIAGEKGYKAFLLGKLKSSNPYKSGSENWAYWNTGWDNAAGNS